MEEESKSILARARKAARMSVPLAPYWEGRTFEEALTTSVWELRSEPDRATLYERLLTLLDAGLLLSFSPSGGRTARFRAAAYDAPRLRSVFVVC
jgi:hypothetical protein